MVVPPVLALAIGGIALSVAARWWTAAPVRVDAEPPESLVCAQGAPCDPTWRTFWYPLDRDELSAFRFASMSPEARDAVLRAIVDRCRALGESGVVPVLVHVGANNMKKERDMYRFLLSKITVPYRLVLVEPNANLVPALSKEAASLDLGAAHAPLVVNVAICPDRGQKMTLYVPSPDNILADFRLHRWLATFGFIDPGVLSEVASLDYERTANSLKEFHRLPHVKQEYINELPVRCATPADLMADVGASARDVAFLAVDTEGFDAQLLAMFLGLQGFDPAVVQFEWAGHHSNDTTKVEALRDIAMALHARGYELRKEQENMIARIPDDVQGS